MKEFDIYLNKRLTECDIIVYSIPYRDRLTVEAATQITAEAAFIMKRCRLIKEMDDDKVVDYDNMTLDSIDYVIL